MFGTKSNRFNQKIEQNPGPGHYTQEKGEKKKVHSTNTLGVAKPSNFNQNTTRDNRT